jgi:antagonist of KipI
MIEVLDAGWTSIQDRGRPGHEREGIPPGGCADRFSAAVANRLVGNDPAAALLECTSRGPTLRFAQDAVIALTGGEAQAGETWRAREVKAGDTVALGLVSPGFRCYLGLRGGIDVPMVLGSRSLSERGSFGGGFGRRLRSGDRFEVGGMVTGDPLTSPWPSAHRLPRSGPSEIRAMPGPHDDRFANADVTRFLETAFVITPLTDRMGIRLTAPSFRVRVGEILTTPVSEGAVQVTPSGELIVLLADHPTSGGYPVIATAISADLPLLAQARPGETVRFRAVNAAEAGRARRRLEGWLDQ